MKSVTTDDLKNALSKQKDVADAVSSMKFAITEAIKSHTIADVIFKKRMSTKLKNEEEMERIEFQMKIEIMKIKDRDQINNGVKSLFFLLELQSFLKNIKKK